MDRDECPGFDVLSAHLDGALSSAEDGAALEEHLRLCTACRTQLVEMRELSHALGASAEAIPPIDVVEQVRYRIAGQGATEKSRRQAIGFVPLALAASIVLGFGVTLGTRLVSQVPPADLSTTVRLAPFGAVPPGNVCLNYPRCYRR